MAIWGYDLARPWRKGSVASPKGAVRVDDGWLPSVPDEILEVQSPRDAEVVNEVNVDARPGIHWVPYVPVTFVCCLVRAVYGGGLWRVIALKALVLDTEEVGDPVRPLCHWELSEGGGVFLGLCDGRLVEVQEVDGGLGGRGPGL